MRLTCIADQSLLVNPSRSRCYKTLVRRCRSPWHLSRHKGAHVQIYWRTMETNFCICEWKPHVSVSFRSIILLLVETEGHFVYTHADLMNDVTSAPTQEDLCSLSLFLSPYKFQKYSVLFILQTFIWDKGFYYLLLLLLLQLLQLLSLNCSSLCNEHSGLDDTLPLIKGCLMCLVSP
jgi:hypothetical protein